MTGAQLVAGTAGEDTQQWAITMIVGSDAHDRLVTQSGEEVYSEGVTDFSLLRVRDPHKRPTAHVSRSFFRQSTRYRFDNVDCIVNLVTDPDQNPKVLANLTKLLRDYKGRVINPPEKVLGTTRELVARRLAGMPGMIVPEIVRLSTTKPAIVLSQLERAGIRYPAIVRTAGTHRGNIIGLIERAEDIPPALKRGEDHFVTSYVDYRSPDGLYRKYRVFFIGRHIILRHLLHSDHWNVHAADRDRYMASRAPLIAEEIRLFISGLPPKVMDTLERVRREIGLDFFGIDFGLTEDLDLVLFEANATMNFFPFSTKPCFEYVKDCLRPSQEAVDELLYPEEIREAVSLEAIFAGAQAPRPA